MSYDDIFHNLDFCQDSLEISVCTEFSAMSSQMKFWQNQGGEKYHHMTHRSVKFLFLMLLLPKVLL